MHCLSRLIAVALLVIAAAGCSDSTTKSDAAPDVRVDDQAVGDTTVDAPAADSTVDVGVGDVPAVDTTIDAVTGDTTRDAPASDTTDDAPTPPDLGSGDAAVCAAAKIDVQTEMDRINYCGSATDCTYMFGACPFGCYILHNKAEATTQLSQLISTYRVSLRCNFCVYSCAAPGTLKCTNGKCQMTFP